MVLDNVAQVAILQITKLTTDNGRDARTLRRFRTFIDAAVKDEIGADYRRVLKQAEFRSRIESLIKKAKDLRDKQIAHSVSDQVDAITFAEIKEIVRELTKLFEVASFDAEYRYLIFSYDRDVRRPVDIDPRPDMEPRARRHRAGQPRPAAARVESDGFSAHAEWLVTTKVEQFNRYRRKCGLMEI